MLDPARMDDVLRRGGDVATVVGSWRSLDERRRKLQAELDTKRAAAQRGATSGWRSSTRRSPEFAPARDELKALSTEIKEGETELATLEHDEPAAPARTSRTRRTRAFPIGAERGRTTPCSTRGARSRRSRSRRRRTGSSASALGILDFEAGARIAGARFTVLRGAASRLTRALISYMLDLHTQHGYDEVWPPAVVRRAVAARHRPAAEVRGRSVQARRSPSGPITSPTTICSCRRPPRSRSRTSTPIRSSSRRRCRAGTPRTRRASAPRPAPHGKDTRGLIRQHQFDKVELVKFVDARDQLRRARGAAPGRRARAAGARPSLPRRHAVHRRPRVRRGQDLRPRGLAARPGRLPRDLVVLELRGLPGAGGRRSATGPSAGDKPRPVHTLNGSGIAVGRTIVAILEQYQQADGSVVVPAALRPYVGGLERITRPEPRARHRAGIGSARSREVLADPALQGDRDPYTAALPLGPSWRSGRVVEGSGLENRRAQAPGVRIPPPPQALIIE